MQNTHWDGNKNKAIRWYFYCQRGLNLFNDFRYIFMLIFGIYITAKMSNPLLLFVMFILILPVLMIAGWFQVHHMAPVINWLDITYGSYWSKKSMEWQERQVKAAEETAKNTSDIASIAAISTLKPIKPCQDMAKQEKRLK